ncbi:MAG: nitroreductase family protein [Syntrophobacteraceae bacterium]|jgi:nitroreductase|nr:nitroreductase family protein [Syntrophobacteraceae bacterium]
MADFMEVLRNRRSIRSYQDQDVPESTLNRVLEAVQWSPSWANTQCWEIVVVREAETKVKLQETLSKGNPATKAVLEAPIVLALCGKLQSSGYYKGEVTTKFGDWILYDLGIATQSLCLAAWSLGLGTVVVGLFDHDRARAVLGVPDGYDLVSLIPLGFPAKAPSAPKRREVAEFSHRERF